MIDNISKRIYEDVENISGLIHTLEYGSLEETLDDSTIISFIFLNMFPELTLTKDLQIHLLKHLRNSSIYGNLGYPILSPSDTNKTITQEWDLSGQQKMDHPILVSLSKRQPIT